MRIFGRKKQRHDEDGGRVATMDPADAVVTEPLKTELDKVQDEINLINSERSRLEGQARGHSELIAAIDDESIVIKEKLAAGDVSFTPVLDLVAPVQFPRNITGGP